MRFEHTDYGRGNHIWELVGSRGRFVSLRLWRGIGRRRRTVVSVRGRLRPPRPARTWMEWSR